MKIFTLPILLFGIVSLKAAELRIVPAEPPLEKIRILADSAIIVLLCKPNYDRTKLEVSMVPKGEGNFEAIKDRIADILPESDRNALATNGFRELVFIVPLDDPDKFRCSSSYALWPQREKTLGEQTFRFVAHDLKDLERVIQSPDKNAREATDRDAETSPR